MNKQLKLIRSEKQRGYYWKEIDFIPDYANAQKRPTDSIIIDTSKTYQTHLGFGGAFSEAASYVVASAGEDVRREVASAYFSSNGLCYNMGRMALNSCDFGLSNYYYKSVGNGLDISHEEKWVIPFIKEAEKARGGRLTMFLSPWSPPPEFKTNNEMNYGGKLKPDYYGRWADYMVKTILELKKRGIEIDVVNTQNEPEAVQSWDSCIYTADEEATFLSDYLFPALDRAGLSTKTIIWDHNRDNILKRAKVSFRNKLVRERVWGIGYHWYISNCHKNLEALHTLYPEKNILLTECCVEFSNAVLGVGDFGHGERYGRQIIEDFNNYSQGWIDWNLALDEHGGPNHANNFCESPIMVKDNKVIYNPSYYFIGHFSRYIKVGAVRLKCVNDAEEHLFAVCYKNPDNKLVAVVQNVAGYVKEVEMFIENSAFTLTLPANSITTILF